MSSTGSEIWDALSTRISELAEQAGKAVVAVETGHRVSASGVHWQPGVVVTAAHLVRRVEVVSVLLPNGEGVTGHIAGRDNTTDVAAIRVDGGAGLGALPFGSDVKLGELVLSVGRSRRGELAVAAGVMARTGGPWRSWRGGQIDRLLRPDIQLYPGQSGSALVNGRGELLGINSAVLARASAITVPTETVTRVVNELLERGHISQPYLGVAMQEVPLPEEWQQVAGAGQELGLMVLHVAPESPAKQAGVIPGDLIVSAAGEAVKGYRGLHRMLAQKRTGDALQLRLLRSGIVKDVSIILGDRPKR